MDCPNCFKEMELIDTTYSNYNSRRAYEGQHTGDVYECKKCEMVYLNDFLINKLYEWNYS